MAEAHVITAEARDRTGKGSARATRREGRVPGVVYGDKKEPVAISLDRRELERELNKGGFFSRLFELKLDGESQRVLARDMQFHVVSDVPLHVDFLRLSRGARIVIDLPVVFLNEDSSPGLRQGGVLNVVRHEIEVRCDPDAIPEHIECDLAGLEIGDSLHISAVKLPAGVEPTITDRDFTIATIAAPTVHVEPAEGAAEEAEAAEQAEAAGEAEKEESE